MLIKRNERCNIKLVISAGEEFKSFKREDLIYLKANFRTFGRISIYHLYLGVIDLFTIISDLIK